MPKRAKELSALEVKRLEYPHDDMQAKGNKLLPVFKAVGGVAGLQLQLTPGEGKSWILRYAMGGKRRSMGLGPYPEVSVAEARDRAREAKAKLREGRDPIQEQKDLRRARDAEAQRLSFAKAIDGWEREHPNEFSSDKHRQIWLSSVRNIKALQDLRVDRITQEDVWRCLEPIAKQTPDTARRLRGRIEKVLAWAEDEKQREGENPASTGWLKRKLAAKVKGAKTENFPALQVEDAPRFMAALRKLEGNGSRALEFVMLTAARSGEVRGAVWNEVDLDKGVWIVPGARMKMKRDHTVPLPEDAINLLKAMQTAQPEPTNPRMGELIFPAPRGGELSDVVMTATMKRMQEAEEKAGRIGFVDKETGRRAVPHGMRSCFRVWAGQQGYSREHAELALAHQFGDAVEQAYQRDIYTEQRRPMMTAWSDYLSGRAQADNVVELKRG